MPLPIVFAGLTAPVMADLDSNFNALGALTAIPCAFSGTNTLSLTPDANTPTIAAYVNYQVFVGIASGTNTGPVTASVNGLAALNVYKNAPAGPVPLTGGEIAEYNAVLLLYNSVLNAGVGGFILIVSLANPTVGAAPVTITSSSGTSITAATLTGSGAGLAVVVRAGSPGSGFNDSLDSAANIVNAIPSCGIDTYFRTRLLNTTGQTQTLTASGAVTLAGVTTTVAGATHDLVGVVTAIAIPAVTIYG